MDNGISLMVVILLIYYINANNGDHHIWSYDHQESWPSHCKKNHRQSPIPLVSSEAKHKRIPPIIFENYDIPHIATLTNNGHTDNVKFLYDPVPALKGGGFKHEYILDSLHFHWQSEHTMDGKRYPLEAHFVHYAKKYDNLSEALKHHNGIAVLGTVYTISSHSSKGFPNLTRSVSKISKKIDMSIKLKHKLTPKWFLPCSTKHFYRYSGSLTTPNCNEVVVWTLFTKPAHISTHQLEQLSKIWTFGNVSLKKNYRKLQFVNDRSIYLT